jgi:hypothetical protein
MAAEVLWTQAVIHALLELPQKELDVIQALERNSQAAAQSANVARRDFCPPCAKAFLESRTV